MQTNCACNKNVIFVVTDHSVSNNIVGDVIDRVFFLRSGGGGGGGSCKPPASLEFSLKIIVMIVTISQCTYW